MASELDVTSDSSDVGIVDVPEVLLPYVKSKIVECVNNAKDFSAKVLYGEGQPPKLMVSFDAKKDQTRQFPWAESYSADDCSDTDTILVKNLPESADEELLGFFFESNKKYGGVPVKNVKILSGKNVAIIEFCERKSVETVLGKRPIKLGKAELIILPYKPLLTIGKTLDCAMVDIQGLPREFNDDLELEYLENKCGPALAALINEGSRVVRGRDWRDGDKDGGGKGTVVQKIGGNLVDVKWDNDHTYRYCTGRYGRYEIKLA